MVRNTAIALFIAASMCVSGCLDSSEENFVPDTPVIPPLTKDELVIANCEIVRDALEAYASENDGEYPVTDSDRNLADKGLRDYLPGGQQLANPYTGTATEPTYGALGVQAGSTGYIARSDSQDRLTGYRINGIGEVAGEDIVRIDKAPEN